MSKPKPSPLIQFYPDRETPVFTGNTAITVITQKTLRDPILPMFSGGIGGKIKGWEERLRDGS
jgi:hypothetical protein